MGTNERKSKIWREIKYCLERFLGFDSVIIAHKDWAYIFRLRSRPLPSLQWRRCELKTTTAIPRISQAVPSYVIDCQAQP